MQKSFLSRSMIILMLVSMSACSALKFPGVYRINIQQGNVITQDMIDQLKAGMTKRQVRFVLGTPLIDDPFAADRWDYYYSFTNPRAKSFNHSVTVYFDGDVIKDLEATEKFVIPAELSQTEHPEQPTETPDAD